MMSYRIAFISLLYIFSLQIILSQGEIDDQAKIFYRNEKTLGLLINSNGYAVSGRYAKQINARNKKIYTSDIAIFKHPKETKIQTGDFRSFVNGKLNTFFTVRGGIGFQHELYRKLDKGGISIRYFYDFGPSIGFFKPIYYEVAEYLTASTYRFYPAKFDPTVEQYIVGKYSFFKGLNEIQINPGAYGRLGFCFEYSSADKVIHAIEAGIVMDAFIRKVPIMAETKEQFLYPALFISYRFGKVVDARFSAKKRKELEKESELPK